MWFDKRVRGGARNVPTGGKGARTTNASNEEFLTAKNW